MKTTTDIKLSKMFETRNQARIIENCLLMIVPPDITVGTEFDAEWNTYHVFYNDRAGVKQYIAPERDKPCGMCFPMGLLSSCHRDNCKYNVPIKF